jgi:CRISPR-associated protein Csx10
MKAIHLIIELKSPLLVAGVHYGDENSRISLDYVPGSTIKGAVISQFLRNNKLDNDVMHKSDSDARKVFFDDKVRFLNAYPYTDVFPGYPRALPVPASWYIEKSDKENQNDDRQVWDFAVEVTDLEQGKTEPRKYFWQVVEEIDDDKKRYPLVSPSMVSSVHNMSVKPHIKSSDNSTVFRYDVLAAGQVFCAYILAKDETLLDQVDKYIPTGSVFLGGSRGARYGHTEFIKNTVDNWKEYDSHNDSTGDEVSFTLLSDLILKNASGESSFDFSEALKEKLGLKEKPTPIRAFVKTGATGSFNRKWGLPTIQDQIISKGSCFVYKKDDHLSPDAEAVKNLVVWGLGEHQSDGFGRIAVNLGSEDTFYSYTPNESNGSNLELSEESKRLVARVADKQLQERVENEILSYLQKVQVNSQPENAQLNKLRILARQAARNPEAADLEIKGFFENLKEEAFLQFDRRHIKVSGKQITWHAWVDGLIKNPDGIRELELSEPDWTFFGEIIPPTASKKAEIAYRLIDAVAAKAIKTKE